MKEKKILLIRHAKAEDTFESNSDYHRNLKIKGIEKAQEVALLLKDKIHLNDQTAIISSPAYRAIQTAKIFCVTWNYSIDRIIQIPNIYEATYIDILKEINKISNQIETIILFGHNPGLSDLTKYICNTYISLSTSAVAEITVEDGLDFTHISENTAHLNHVFGQ